MDHTSRQIHYEEAYSHHTHRPCYSVGGARLTEVCEDWRAARTLDPLSGRRPRESESALPPPSRNAPHREHSPISLFTPLHRASGALCSLPHDFGNSPLRRGKVLRGKIASALAPVNTATTDACVQLTDHSSGTIN